MKSEWEWIEEKCSCFHTRSNTDMLQWTISAQMCAFCLTYILQLCVVIFKPLYPLKIKQKHGELLIEKTFYEKLRLFFNKLLLLSGWLHTRIEARKRKRVCAWLRVRRKERGRRNHCIVAETMNRPIIMCAYV